MAIRQSRTHSPRIAADQPADDLRYVVGSYPSLAITNNRINTPSDDSSTTYVGVTRLKDACPSLCFQMDNKVWDVVHEEMMDWRDSSWTSMDLPGKKTCENIVQPYATAGTKAMLTVLSSLHHMPSFLGRPGTSWIGKR